MGYSTGSRFNLMNWVCLFSQTGKEIVDLSERVGRCPDLIITNAPREKIVPEIYSLKFVNITWVCDRPKPHHYYSILPKRKEGVIITLHGWLRIIPKEVCEDWAGKIFNGHPGLITKYPQLKGQNPQKKAFDLGLPTSGSVVHAVSPEVDEGEIFTYKETDIAGLSLDEVYNKLRLTSLDAWEDFFYNKLSY
jgi:formyltetrahydrofolate hydrolase